MEGRKGARRSPGAYSGSTVAPALRITGKSSHVVRLGVIIVGEVGSAEVVNTVKTKPRFGANAIPVWGGK